MNKIININLHEWKIVGTQVNCLHTENLLLFFQK